MALENLQDPGNLGTIVRTAEGAGVTGILMSRGCVDIYNSKVIRSTMGSIYRMPFVYTDQWEEALRELKRQGVSLYAAHLKGQDYHDRQDYTKPAAFLIGNESRGLTEETAALADTYIRIPMCGQVESLNAAVASSILMYEANRQRRQADR
jgi:TrmH family RNA methyltransferase